LAITFFLGAVNANSLNTNAAIAVGENQLPAWSAHRKVNNGLGFQVGAFLNTANPTLIVDTDFLDGQMNNANVAPSLQNQTL